MLLTFLRISVSLIFFSNKILVLIGKNSTGWLMGSIAGILAIFYFFLLELYVYMVMEFGIFVLMFYGFLIGKEKNTKTELIINWFLIGILGAFAYFVFSGILTIVEFFSSIAFLLGTYYLIHTKPRLGWILYVLAHAGSTYLGFEKKENFFATFQLASVIVAIIGFLYPNLNRE
ncbi:MAG: hypothetical protein UR70_C0009G0001 [Candidatus Nomurabacteria bacterium GW2011_GWB1_35_20]|uniref:Uncharacterized protein n=3 Tax=Candidatus Nomuraibacteriota TaxID=1752729 RepID=A0A0G0GC37_9BACT|nr:MAG: hypothetical protein UR70_C0009G0001 [Candidatus Nomurabacteria bacterium GW2011_GWB1_35_20]KKP76499.1 MAG: hypothetical protein UR72_C0002G0145 [Parcubacteria group bacterium GW2011_GWC1_35_21]KKP77906.1 MAG: hypothetical protein UR77_C0010G0001 [Candidatus Nomurabacteria bacterium GW2011_GWC2_35_35]KKP84854.1 MAG: hypothetical protein UR86_C0018G0001 [Parcubacteria group bacterium GW2011_GWD2_35_7]KKP88326.1 MAG: hypothetical protein UR92_C0007G0001 [Candidatus Nomurabacteria bacteriu